MLIIFLLLNVSYIQIEKKLHFSIEAFILFIRFIQLYFITPLKRSNYGMGTFPLVPHRHTCLWNSVILTLNISHYKEDTRKELWYLRNKCILWFISYLIWLVKDSRQNGNFTFHFHNVSAVISLIPSQMIYFTSESLAIDHKDLSCNVISFPLS